MKPCLCMTSSYWLYICGLQLFPTTCFWKPHRWHFWRNVNWKPCRTNSGKFWSLVRRSSQLWRPQRLLLRPSKSKDRQPKAKTDLTLVVLCCVCTVLVFCKGPFYCVCARKLKVLSHLHQVSAKGRRRGRETPRIRLPPPASSRRRAADIQGRF